MQNEDMTPAEWHNHEEYEAHTKAAEGIIDNEFLLKEPELKAGAQLLMF